MPKTILIVDDDNINRQLLRRILSADYAVEEAQDGREAMSFLTRNYRIVSAVLLDIVMPVMDGYEMLETMMGHPMLSQIPVIVTTGSTELEAEKKALALGATDFIPKPFDADIIRRRVGNLIKLRETAAMINTLQKDKLTGLWNRETFFEKASWEIRRKPAGYYTLSCVDIDNFKVINDQYGTERGDEVLKSLARVLRRDCDAGGSLCGRISGDNFIILYPTRLTPEFESKRPRQETLIPGGDGLPVTVSTGRYVVNDTALPVSAMYDRAKIAQSTVKGRYDAHVAVYDEAMLQGIIREQMLVNDMHAALKEGRFETWFQPQYNHATGALIGAEALARWRHPERGLISPGEFVPAFERNGFIYELDKYIWDQVCGYLRKWTDEGRSPLPVSVNISRYDLFRDDLISVLMGLVERYDIPVSLLRLEITESAFAKSTEQVVHVVKQLIACGFTVEIDDFGSGYSSLNTLKDVPAQIVKLDMRFLENADDADRSGNIIESVVRMTKWLGMSVIAEGVETMLQADYLKSIGCTYVQGYLYARSMPAAEYEALAKGADKEERLLVMETVESFERGAFWDPESMDTLIFNSYVGAACIFEYKDGRCEVLRANEKYAKILGDDVTLEQMMALSWEDSLDEGSAAARAQTLRDAVESGREVSDEFIYRDPLGDGRDFYIRCSMRVIASAGNRFLFYCRLENTTAQREAEQRIRSLNDELNIMMNDTPGGFARMRVLPDGSIKTVYVNDPFCRMRGMTREEILEADRHDAMLPVHPDDAQRVRAVIGEMIATGETCRVRYRLRAASGRYVPCTVFGRMTKKAGGEMYINAYFADMSDPRDAGREGAELAEARAELRISREEYRLAATLSNRTVLRYDVRERRLTVISQGSEELSFAQIDDQAPEAALGAFRLLPEYTDAFRAMFAAIERGDAGARTLVVGADGDGQKRWAEWWYEIIRDTDGDPATAILSVEDITERKRIENLFNVSSTFLDTTENVIHLLVFNLSSGEIEFESNGPHGRLSDRAGTKTLEKIKRYILKSKVYAPDADAFNTFFDPERAIRAYKRGSPEEVFEYRSISSRGEVRWMSVRTHALQDAATQEYKIYVVFVDIHDKKTEQLELLRRAQTDSLTGLMNRESFESALRALCAPEKERGELHAVIMVDIDKFKQVNDTFGHDVGDRTLADVGERLRAALRDSDVIARYGGDEFIALLPNMSSVGHIEQSCRRVNRALHFKTGDGVVVSASLGVAVCPTDGGDYDTLLKRADVAMYEAKKAGGNRFSLYHNTASA